MKKILLLFIILFLTGCNSYVELNNLGVINSIAIEKNNNYKLYASIIIEVAENGNPKTKIYEIEGKNIIESFDNLSISLNKKIYLSHLDLLIINDSIKDNELLEIINYFLNNNETREDFLIITSNDLKKILENTKWQEINDLIRINHTETSKSIYTTMYDLMNNYFKKSPIYLTNIKYDQNININGITKIYHNKHQLIQNDKSLFINYLLNNIETYKYNFECDNNKYLYLNILTSNTNIINNTLFITNEIKVINNECNLNKKDINKLFNNYLKSNLKEFTNKNINIENTIRSLYENN